MQKQVNEFRWNKLLPLIAFFFFGKRSTELSPKYNWEIVKGD